MLTSGVFYGRRCAGATGFASAQQERANTSLTYSANNSLHNSSAGTGVPSFADMAFAFRHWQS
jgi:hypothetical protein